MSFVIVASRCRSLFPRAAVAARHDTASGHHFRSVEGRLLRSPRGRRPTRHRRRDGLRPEGADLHDLGAGVNMWATRDEFQFAWRKLSGDFIVRTHAAFLGKGVDPHRKLGWIVRKSLDADSPYVDAAIHGDGLTSLQFRRTPGAVTEQIGVDGQGARRDSARTHRRQVHHVGREVRRALHAHGGGRRGSRRRGLCRAVRLLAQSEGVGEGRLPQRAHRGSAEGRLDAVSRLHRQQPGSDGHRDRPSHRAPHRDRFDSGAELDDRRQGADLQRRRQAVSLRPGRASPR